jgi:hypothetical protein
MREDVKDLSEKERMETFIFLFGKYLEAQVKSSNSYEGRSIAETCHGSAATEGIQRKYIEMAKDYGLVE